MVLVARFNSTPVTRTVAGNLTVTLPIVSSICEPFGNILAEADIATSPVSTLIRLPVTVNAILTPPGSPNG